MRYQPRGRRPDVLLVSDGANVHIRRLAEALAENDVRVELACFEGAPIGGVTLHRLGQMPPRADRRYPFAVPAVARLLPRRRPRVVHALFVSSYELMTALALQAAKLGTGDLRTVQSPLGTDLLVTAGRRTWRAAAAAFTLRTADLATFNARSLEAEVRRLAPNTPRHRFVCGPVRSLLTGTQESRPVALSTRRHEPDVRVELVVGAWLEARRRAPEVLAGWTLVVTHTGSCLEQFAKPPGGDESIGLVGVVSRHALHELLRGSRMLISAPVSDATSAALMDALAAGLTPVVNAIPGTLEWVDQSIAEIVPRDPTVGELAEAIIRAAQRPADRQALQRRVADIVWEDELQRLMDAYSQLVERGDQPHVRPG